MNTHVSLPVMDTVKEAWDKQSGAKATIWGVLLIIIVIRLVSSGLDAVVNHDIVSNSIIELIIGLFVFALSILSTMLNWGLIHIGIKRAVSQPIAFGDVKHVFRWMIFFKMVGLYILQFLIMLPAIALMMAPLYLPSVLEPESTMLYVANAVLIILGVVLMVFLLMRMFVATGLVLFGEKGPWMAIRISFRVTKGNVFALLGLSILNFLIVLVSMIPLGIGLIWTIPYALINYGVVYKKLYDDVKVHH